MPRDLAAVSAQSKAFDSVALAEAIARTDFSGSSATVIGYGYVGKEYVKALRALGVGNIRVCSRSAAPLAELTESDNLESTSGGFETFECRPHDGELGIVATPVASLVPAAERLAELGFKKLLIEKPVALHSVEIERLAADLEKRDVMAACAYNRTAYPSFYEVRARTIAEGGITSCTYTFTEMIKPNWLERFAAEELAHWGIMNSSHVLSMAHGLIGPPSSFEGRVAGSLPWHPSGAVFVGSGLSERAVPYSYHADWGSAGRWSVEVHTAVSSYRLCPLEEVKRKTSALGDWEDIPVTTFAPSVKAGFAEQIAVNLGLAVEPAPISYSLVEAAALVRYAERVFDYVPRERSSL